MVKDTITKRSTETIDDLEIEKREIEDKIRAKKKAETEINLQEAVDKMKVGEDRVDEVIKACYAYIATHRRRK